MKDLLRKIFSPILAPFEKGDDEFKYNPLGRKILVTVSVLFTFLATVVANLIPADGDPGYYFPVAIFGCVGFIGLVVGLLGNDRAVAKIWGNK